MHIAQHKPVKEDYWFDNFQSVDQTTLLLDAFRSHTIGLLPRYAGRDSWIIEGGCSTGRYMKALGMLGYKNVYGFDIDEKLVGMALADNLNAKVGSVLNIPFRRGFADVYLDLGVLEHLSFADQNKSLGEINRVLKDNGVLIQTCAYLNPVRTILYPYLKFKNEFYMKTVRQYPFHQYIRDRQEVSRQLQGHGFKIIGFINHLPSRATFIAQKDRCLDY